MLFLSLSVIFSLLLFFISFKTQEKWMKSEKMHPFDWKKLNLVALSVTLLANFGLSFFIADHINDSASLSALLAAVTSSLVYTSVQTVTDFKVRRAYRWTLIMGYVSVIACALWDYAANDMMSSFMFYLLVLIIVGLGILFKGIGMSDTRAMILVCASIVPIAGVQGLNYYLYLFLFFLIGYTLIFKIRNKEVKILTTKISFPMVPIFIWPALIIVLKTVLL